MLADMYILCLFVVVFFFAIDRYKHSHFHSLMCPKGTSLFFFCPFIPFLVGHLFVCFKEPFEQMIINMQRKNEISPSLNEIVCHFDEVNQGSAESFCVDQNSNLVPDVVHDREHDLDNWQHDSWELNHDNKKNVFKENIDSGDATFDSHCEVFDL